MTSEYEIHPRCGTCKHRSDSGLCTSGKMVEYGDSDGCCTDDMLVYPYNEGGSFWVGPYFGCVHHVPK